MRAHDRLLPRKGEKSSWPVAEKGTRAYLKRYVVVAYADFQLLTAILVLLRPFGVVFPGQGKLLSRCGQLQHCTYFKISLSFTIFLISANKVSLTHTNLISKASNRDFSCHTLFPDEGVVSIVGVVRISGGCAAAISEHTEIELYAILAALRPLQAGQLT